MRYRSLAFLVLCACSTSGSSTPATEDAAAAPEDASSDAPNVPSMDAGAADDAGAGWCAINGLHFFCDDFDEDPLAHDWDSTVSQHGSLSLDRATSTSEPFSLLAQSTALTTGAVARVALSKSIVDAAPHLHFAVDVEADAIDGGASVVVLSIDLLDPTGDVSETLDLSIAKAGASLDDHAGAFSASHPFALPKIATPGAWSRIKIDAAFEEDGGIGGATVTVSVDGRTSVDLAPLAPTAQASLPSLQLGIVSATGPSPAVSVHFDNLTFDTLP